MSESEEAVVYGCQSRQWRWPVVVGVGGGGGGVLGWIGGVWTLQMKRVGDMKRVGEGFKDRKSTRLNSSH